MGSNVQPTPSIGALGQWNVSTCHDINSTDDCCHFANACSTQVNTFYYPRLHTFPIPLFGHIITPGTTEMVRINEWSYLACA